MRRGAACAVAAMVAGIAACGSGSAGGADGGRGGTLTIAEDTQTSVNPALAAPPVFAYPAYDSLIHESSSGQYQPDLATSWGFAGSGHTVFRLTLRRGVRFTDGSLMTGEAVAKSLLYSIGAKGPAASNAGPVKTIEATGTYTVDIVYSQPVPSVYVIRSLTQDQSLGLIIGPSGVANPASLTTSSDGVGPYQLSQSTTDSYTFVPNSRYFNQSAIKYDKVVMETMTDPNARLDAARSGQIDAATQMPPDAVTTASSAGLTVSEHGAQLATLFLENRVSGPLANATVRQAISLAIDRQAIIKTVYSGIGTAQSSIGVKGTAGYDGASPYPYDVGRARTLLAEAGYARGFTFTAVDSIANDAGGLFGEAIAQ